MTAVAGHDFVAYGKTDAGSTILGTSFIELLFYVGKFVGRDSTSIVTHGDFYVFSGQFCTYIHIFTVFAVSGGIVQNIQEDLF